MAEHEAHTQLLTTLQHVRLEVLAAVTMKNGIFWDVTPCSSVKTDVSEELSTSIIRGTELVN
jgi:hypothetical protein